jgi:hypothetical protein
LSRTNEAYVVAEACEEIFLKVRRDCVEIASRLRRDCVETVCLMAYLMTSDDV